MTNVSTNQVGMEFHWVESGDQRLATSIDLPATSAPWPVVLHFHGLSGDRIGRAYVCVEFGRRLAAAGIACVRFDHAGCGESSGDGAAYSMQSVMNDGAHLAEFLRSDGRFDLTRLGVVGTSLGSLGALSFDARFGSRQTALLAPVYDLAGLTARTGKEDEARAAIAMLGFAPFKGIRLGPGYFEHLDLLNADELLARSDSPILVAHAREDDTVPFTETEALVARCAAIGRPCRLIELEGTAHDFYEEPLRSHVLELSTTVFVESLLNSTTDD